MARKGSCDVRHLRPCRSGGIAARVAMLQRMAHRGPDAEGIWGDQSWILGHRRVAVVDLSDAGRQPLLTDDRMLVTVVNGGSTISATAPHDTAIRGALWHPNRVMVRTVWRLPQGWHQSGTIFSWKQPDTGMCVDRAKPIIAPKGLAKECLAGIETKALSSAMTRSAQALGSAMAVAAPSRK
jgi:hypothetical protein